MSISEETAQLIVHLTFPPPSNQTPSIEDHQFLTKEDFGKIKGVQLRNVINDQDQKDSIVGKMVEAAGNRGVTIDDDESLKILQYLAAAQKAMFEDKDDLAGEIGDADVKAQFGSLSLAEDDDIHDAVYEAMPGFAAAHGYKFIGHVYPDYTNTSEPKIEPISDDDEELLDIMSDIDPGVAEKTRKALESGSSVAEEFGLDPNEHGPAEERRPVTSTPTGTDRRSAFQLIELPPARDLSPETDAGLKAWTARTEAATAVRLTEKERSPKILEILLSVADVHKDDKDWLDKFFKGMLWGNPLDHIEAILDDTKPKKLRKGIGWTRKNRDRIESELVNEFGSLSLEDAERSLFIDKVRGLITAVPATTPPTP